MNVKVAGDTLRGIAYKAWGDGKLWYLIADANGRMTDWNKVALCKHWLLNAAYEGVRWRYTDSGNFRWLHMPCVAA